MFAAILRASLRVSTRACRASFSSRVGDGLPVPAPHGERLFKLADGPGRGEAAGRRGHSQSFGLVRPLARSEPGTSAEPLSA